MAARGLSGVLLVSPHAYTDDREITAFVEALARVLHGLRRGAGGSDRTGLAPPPPRHGRTDVRWRAVAETFFVLLSARGRSSRKRQEFPP